LADGGDVEPLFLRRWGRRPAHTWRQILSREGGKISTEGRKEAPNKKLRRKKKDTAKHRGFCNAVPKKRTSPGDKKDRKRAQIVRKTSRGRFRNCGPEQPVFSPDLTSHHKILCANKRGEIFRK